ncbi:NAD(P)/FAD-dependent oxidoreductase [Arachidicoccus soli]|uniref:FAD-binding protein n=1 Tax=Arachidicoccus soli TaxID=2341117 RepID=A0A386HQ14_9BACT|nr:FAD-dependent oxidoreductase [Arachidicoccus soli]AYD47935.1 FAD-binding protein [Arachidicoccus soli]
MQQKVQLRLKPLEANDEKIIRQKIAESISQNPGNISGFTILKKSLDARSRQVWVNLMLSVFVQEPYLRRTITEVGLKDVRHSSKKVIVIGAGPAGLFAALKLIEQGIQPIILERGKDVKSRRRDLAELNKKGVVNPESNYCFGEGGAGTYSDGKLYTRSNKRGSIDRVLNIFVQFGAEEKILYEAHPHIGTNKLPQIMVAMREAILAAGGQFLFEKKVIDFELLNGQIKSVQTADGDSFSAAAVVLATGHSARDIFELLHKKNILIEAKPFALGVRVEHPQALINQIQYHCTASEIEANFLPPASYSLVEQVNGRGVFSFCMCPGGIIAPAATAPGELVVNGWSPSKRNNPFANSGMVVQVNLEDALHYFKEDKPDASDPLLLMKFQQRIEQKCFEAGGGNFVAPAQRMIDFCTDKKSVNLPQNSYIPGLQPIELKNIFPSFITQTLKDAFKAFGKRMHGYYSNDAVIVATESRTSSPVRIPRDSETLQHPQIENMYPCGEGAGYAGGIISAAMDGERVVEAICRNVFDKKLDAQ